MFISIMPLKIRRFGFTQKGFNDGILATKTEIVLILNKTKTIKPN